MLVLKDRYHVTILHPASQEEFGIMIENFDEAGVRWNSGDRASEFYHYHEGDHLCLTYRDDRHNYALTYCSSRYSAPNTIRRKVTDIIIDNRLEAV